MDWVYGVEKRRRAYIVGGTDMVVVSDLAEEEDAIEVVSWFVPVVSAEGQGRVPNKVDDVDA